MTYYILRIILPTLAIATFQFASGQEKKKKNRRHPIETRMPAAVGDTIKKPIDSLPKKAKSGIKPYAELITPKAISLKGLFTIHQIDDKYYAEIPISLLGREFFVVNRISQIVAQNEAKNSNKIASYSGNPTDVYTFNITRGINDKVYLNNAEQITKYDTIIENNLLRNFDKNKTQWLNPDLPILAYNTKGTDTLSIVIDFTDFFNSKDKEFKSLIQKGSEKKQDAWITGLKTFPENIEIKTYLAKVGVDQTMATNPEIDHDCIFEHYAESVSIQNESSNTSELNTSIVLLPEIPMRPRYFDDRVGYICRTTERILSINPNENKTKELVSRMRMEPKPEDIEKYKRGELVEPKKQLVYYVDNTIPKKWIPYIIEGVNDWQEAFEQAGFKNAIIGKAAPTYEEDSTFSLLDGRHHTITYQSSNTLNAMGAHTKDPRSGEIITANVFWFHNIMQLLQNWYFVQAATVDPRARAAEFPDTLMGDLIRFVSSHEVGHTLGLRHNFGASSFTPVEKLRDKEWVEANGHTSSIMDYARFNYVAQPEDNVSPMGIYPRIGKYDKWAIEWAYRYFPETNSVEQENKIVNNITTATLNKNPALYWLDGEGRGRGSDPRSLTEDLGDNAIAASNYSIKNLKIILPNLLKWTSNEKNGTYNSFIERYAEILDQYTRYIGHIESRISGKEYTPKNTDQQGPLFIDTEKSKQKQALSWICDNVFKIPTWIVPNFPNPAPAVNRIAYNKFKDVQAQNMSNILVSISESNLEGKDILKTYTADETLTDLLNSIFSELNTQKPIDLYRRNTQYKCVIGMIAIYTDTKATTSDAVFGFHLKGLLTKIKTAIPLYKDQMSRIHLEALKDKITQALK